MVELHEIRRELKVDFAWGVLLCPRRRPSHPHLKASSFFLILRLQGSVGFLLQFAFATIPELSYNQVPTEAWGSGFQ